MCLIANAFDDTRAPKLNMFSGHFSFESIEVQYDGEESNKELESLIREDKIKHVQAIMSKSGDGVIRVTLVIQFEDMICSLSLNDSSRWHIWTKQNEMLKKQMVGDENDNTFFAAAGSTGDRVFRLSQSQEGLLSKTEVYKLSGSKIFGLQIDSMSPKSLFVIDNKNRVHHIAEKGAEFFADRITELAASIPNDNRDWFSAQVSPNCVVIDGTIHSDQVDGLGKTVMSLKHYFGQKEESANNENFEPRNMKQSLPLLMNYSMVFVGEAAENMHCFI